MNCENQYGRNNSNSDYSSDELDGFPDYKNWSEVDKELDAWYFDCNIGITPVNNYTNNMLNKELDRYERYTYGEINLKIEKLIEEYKENKGR